MVKVQISVKPRFYRLLSVCLNFELLPIDHGKTCLGTKTRTLSLLFTQNQFTMSEENV